MVHLNIAETLRTHLFWHKMIDLAQQIQHDSLDKMLVYMC